MKTSRPVDVFGAGPRNFFHSACESWVAWIHDHGAKSSSTENDDDEDDIGRFDLVYT